ncbi:MAG TPA: thioredoxin domain-containing protein [Solirubrobacteraceae bacterium]|nr:thioredoxin domain-containing protein [Solirubrobacteraceae bacterium]
MANALADETSPYLRQHAENPVDWLPWGAVALARAKQRGVPVLLSIGYSACHWCHVMEHESFEDDEIARQMNEGFVCVKVDREERPDIDALYMEAVQGMTGHGGWPLTVFLTPEGVPFYGGTYFPPQPRPGMPSFSQVLLAVGEAWSERGEEIAAGGENMRERLIGGAALRPSGEGFDERALDTAVKGLREAFDTVHGGFGGAPKFPQTSVIEFLLCRGEPTAIAATGSPTPGQAGDRDGAAAMALYTLRSMAGGGIHDQLGGGFHRYAVDATWTVPHFEKMLYDNALLARAYLHGARLADDAELLDVAVRTLDWMLDEMRGPENGFYSALDADSEGVEGRFYVWTLSDLRGALGEDTDAAIRWLGASEQGNFVDPHHPQPGLNVLEDRGPRPDHATRERIRATLLNVRERRTRPGLDDKRLTSWNALAISALAEVGAYLIGMPAGEPIALPGGLHAAGRRYLDAAVSCAEFVLCHLRNDGGGLVRTYSGGKAKIAAYLEDHAFLLEALIILFEATCDERWLAEARTLADTTIERFGDVEHGGFFSTAADGEALIARRKELEDSPIPAGGSSAALGLLRLAQLTGEQRYEQASAGTITLLSQIAPRHPSAFGHMLQAMHWTLAPTRPIACALPSRQG